jgi:hypothetical protein
MVNFATGEAQDRLVEAWKQALTSREEDDKAD